jgi:hypothetical protein
MSRPFKVAIVRARNDTSVPVIADQICIDMIMTGAQSVFRYWEQTTGSYFDFLDSAMMPWVDITITAADTGRATQAAAAFAALRARDAGHDPLAGFDGAIVLTYPGNMTAANPMAGQPNQPATIMRSFDGGSATVQGIRVSVLPVMSSDQTFMCHELGHTLGFDHTFGLDNNGTDWNPDDANIIVGPEYGSPYDLMSSASFGSRWEGNGPTYTASPTFTGTAVAGWPFAGATSMGPHLSRANLHRWFPDALTGRVIERAAPAAGEVGRVRLIAPGSGNGSTLLVLHPANEPPSGAGRTYVEFRNKTGWDRGLDTDGADLAQVGVVVHTLDDVGGVGPRAWYRGSIAIGAAQLDLTIPTTGVVVSLGDHDDRGGDSAWVDVAYHLPSTHVPSGEILWTDAADGSMQKWFMNLGRVAGRANLIDENGSPILIGYPWYVIGTGDLNQDGAPDILWANNSDGSMQIWTMKANRISSRAGVVDEHGAPIRIGYPWHVVGTGDFNRDGAADILWANATDGSMQIWSMNGARIAGRGNVVDEHGAPIRIGYPWHVVGTGDFNRDGAADILWANATDGSMQIWSMNGASIAGRRNVVDDRGGPVHIGYPWRVAGGEQRTLLRPQEIVWHNATTNETQIWFMDAGKVAGRQTVLGEDGQPTFVGPPWAIVGAADFTLNGSADIVWHNATTNETQIWFMDAGKVAGRQTVLGEDGQPTFVGPPWAIVAV